MGLFLGIDGGGTKIECVLADEAGEIVARAGGAGANLRRVSADELRELLGACFNALRGACGLPSLRPEAVCAGFAGVSDPEARARAQSALTQLLHPPHLYLVGDMEVALEAAVGADAGAVLVAGTGSIAFGRNTEGQTARAGGEGARFSSDGQLTGDAGSGFDIGRRAVEAVLRAEEGRGPETILRDAEIAVLGAEGAEELAAVLVPEQAQELAGLVPLVTRAARRGDPVAGEILESAGTALAELALTVLRELHLAESSVGVFASGGVFSESPEVLSRVRKVLSRAAPRVSVERLQVSPAEGAVRLGLRLWLAEKKKAEEAEEA
jgi:N-acetylglucosamine kinase-like BadF-type ATPase